MTELQNQEPWDAKQGQYKETPPRNNKVRVLNIKTRRKAEKQSGLGERVPLIFKGATIRLTINSSAETIEVKRRWMVSSSC